MTHFAGWPFLDADFNATLFLASLACARRDHAMQMGPKYRHIRSLNEVLSPEFALKIRHPSLPKPTIPHKAMGKQEVSFLKQAVVAIKKRRPEWTPLVDLPVAYHIALNPAVISCSCYAYPQQVFLGKRSFSSSDHLVEQVIHELCHTWTYLVEEFCPLYDCSHKTTYTLPSGTQGKNLGEVLGAAYVAATLTIWNQTRPVGSESSKYTRYLVKYLDGCLEITRNSRILSATGRSLRRRLHRFQSSLSKRSSSPD